MTQPTLSALVEAIERTNFGASALQYVVDPRFQANEIDYKRKLAGSLRSAIDAIAHSDPMWPDFLRRAVQSPEDNIINWRDRGPFLGWCQDDPVAAAHAIATLTMGSGPAATRLDQFSSALASAGLAKPGQQLCIGSVLLMAMDPEDNPPVRARVITNALAALGLSSTTPPQRVGDRYELFLTVLDALIAYSAGGSRRLASRLEAQGAVWCATGGWAPNRPPVDARTLVADTDETADDDIAAAQQDLDSLDDTERMATVAARRGQDRYRRDLQRLWLSCSVTGCTSESMLLASHLKPWRDSSNTERLDKYNGLFLTPNLDHALDKCLIAFTDDGDLLISTSLSHGDAAALGINSGMKLRFVRPEHKPFIAYHRSLFDRREALFSEDRFPTDVAPEGG